jgi:hypothetical protein
MRECMDVNEWADSSRASAPRTLAKRFNMDIHADIHAHIIITFPASFGDMDFVPQSTSSGFGP